MKKLVNHVAFVLDHSGSMDGLQEVSINNFNEQLATLKKESYDQETLVTLVEFDNTILTVYKDRPLDKVDKLDKYWIGGTTALNDAIAFTAYKLKKIPELMEKDSGHSALIVVITDGHENASEDYNGFNDGVKRLKALISELEATGNWTFTFMGANLDVQAVAVSGMNLNVGNTMSFDSTIDGVGHATQSLSSGLQAYYSARRSGSTSVGNFYGTTTEPAPVYDSGNPDPMQINTTWTNSTDSNK